MKTTVINEIEAYIQQHLDDHPGAWENEHCPFLLNWINGLNSKTANEFPNGIWQWDAHMLYELAEPVYLSNNPHLDAALIYAKIFIALENWEQISVTAQRLYFCFQTDDFKEWPIDVMTSVVNQLYLAMNHTRHSKEIESYLSFINLLDNQQN